MPKGMHGVSRGRMHGVRLWALVALMALVAAACSGSKDASQLADRSPRPGETALPDFETPVPEGEDPDAGEAGSTGTGSVGSATDGRDRSSATVAAPGEAPTVTTDESTGEPVANLFKPSENTVGITKDEIVICMHAAFVLGDVFNNKREDEDVYWRKLNAEGGVHGRKVRVEFEDDAYSPDQAVTAANRCKDQHKAFFILSGVGFDQIPRVREWAETNRQLYFYSMATENGAKGKQFSFAVAPTLQTVGRQVAEWLLSAHPGKKYAILSRNSPNWDGVFDVFKAKLGNKLVFDRKVDNGQDYNVVLNDLKGACPQDECVVFANENVLNFAKMYEQANRPPHNYRPLWFNYGFQLTNDTLGSSTAAAPPVEAWYPTPAFDPLNETKQPWWGEVQAMKAAYDKYCTGECSKSGSEVNDVDWQFWLAFKSLHKLLLDCGQDCTRNRIVGELLSGYKAKVDPLCEADFSKGSHHFGATKANIYRAAPHSGGSVWKQVQTCKASF